MGWTSEELYGSQQAERLSVPHSVQAHPGGDLGLCSLPGILSVGWSGWSEKLIAYLYLVPRLRMSGAIPSLPTCLHGVDRDNFKFTLYFSLSLVLLGLSFSCIYSFILPLMFSLLHGSLGNQISVCLSVCLSVYQSLYFWSFYSVICHAVPAGSHLMGVFLLHSCL